MGWEVTHGLCFFPGAGFSRCHHQCTQSTLSGPSLPVAQLGKWEPTGLAPIRPSTYSTAWEWGKGDVEITPKYPGPLRGAGALLPRTVAVPPTAPPRGLQPAQKGLGCGVLHLSPFPSSTCRLGWGEKRRFREDSVGAHGGGWKGLQRPLEAPRGSPTCTPFSVAASNFFQPKGPPRPLPEPLAPRGRRSP